MATISLRFTEQFLSLPRTTIEVRVLDKCFQRTEFDVTLISEILTRQGLEVEGHTVRGAGLDTVVVGRIESAVAHANASKLQVCQVNVGEATPRQIVCGAPNARPGLYVAVALPGSQLPSQDGKPFEIKVSTIRGSDSHGMLCSRAELGLPVKPEVDGNGIWELNVDAQCGKHVDILAANLGHPLFDVLELNDTLLEVNVLANRPDARTHIGIAREIEVGMRRQQLHIERKSPQFSSLLDEAALVTQVKNNANISNGNIVFSAENELGVSAFFIVVNNIKVVHSPGWMRNLLESLGQNSINNVVDASNFILLAYGQPSHAFDLDKLALAAPGEKKLSLRFAKEGEKFVGLDGKERELSTSDCVVADAQSPQALLGVIGGDHSKVEGQTHSIVIEIANAYPIAVRKSSRRHARITESSMAFEKGIDTTNRFWAACELVNLLGATSPQAPHVVGGLHSRLVARPAAAVEMLSDSAMRQAFGLACDANTAVDFSVLTRLPHHPLLKEAAWKSWVDARLAQHRHLFGPKALKEVLGTDLASCEETASILGWLGFSVEKLPNKTLALATPHWRWLDVGTVTNGVDNGIPDIVEEVARVVGLDNLPEIPLTSAGTSKNDDPHLAVLESTISAAVGLGYIEVAGFHFMREDDLERLGLAGGISALGEPLVLMNPIIRDEPLMHTTLLPDLLRKAARNLAYGTRHGQLCHICRTYQNLSVTGARVFSDNGQYLGIANKIGITPANLHEYSPTMAMLFSREKDQSHRPAETPRLAGLVFGERISKTWQTQTPIEWDLHTVMAHVAETGRSLGLAFRFEKLSPHHPFANALHPGRRVAVICDVQGHPVCVGWVGEMHPRALRNFDISVRTVAFELNMAVICDVKEKTVFVKQRHASASRRFPSMTRDFAFVMDRTVAANTLMNCVRQSATALLGSKVPANLTQVDIFDIYMGKGIPDGKMSIALSITLDPTERTLTDTDIQAVSSCIREAVKSEVGGELRS